MKICLYSPYVPEHTGGGEKYLFDVADVLSQRHDVAIAINRPLDTAQVKKIRAEYESFLNRSLAKITFISTPLGTSTNFFSKLRWTKGFDVMYYQTDGSLFFSLASQNILHIQVPLKLNKSGLIEQLKLRNWRVKNTNSKFTKSIVEKSWPTSIDVVHYPLVELGSDHTFQPKKKQKIILSVGRFFTQLHAKRQDVLVEMFKEVMKAQPQLMKSWKLVLIGGVEDQSFANQVNNLAKGFPIEMHHSVTRDQLIEWYDKASIYWHAAGFEVSEREHPEKVEHFGISTAEAMLAGAAPIVIGKGGQPEILGDDLKPWLWNSKAECIDKTVKIIKDEELLIKVQAQAHERAELFGRRPFEQKLWSMLDA